MKNDTGLMASQIRTLETKMQVLEEHLEELEEDEELIESIVQKALEERIVNEKNLALLQEKFDLQKK
jgi:translation initiation factor 2 beta subunit (eIF-2beta)/eIF-5